MQAFNDGTIPEDLNSKPVGDESQIPNLETISDDQELFLKVLENLKNAVSAVKPEKHPIAHPKVASKKPEQLVISPLEHESDAQHRQSEYTATNESQPVAIRSDVEVPGAMSVTVSDKTKSLILQKLAVGACNLVMECEDDTESMVETRAAHLDPSEMEEYVNRMKVTGVGGSNIGKVLVSTLPTEIVTQGRVIHKEVAGKVDKDKIVTIQGGVPNLVVQKNRLVAPVMATKPLFSCKFCDYYSDNKSYLKQHMDLVHNSDRPFKCPYCDYAGKRSHSLREHLIVHSNDRPYQCQSCNATFRKKGHLTNHVKLHNSKRLVKCPICKTLVYDIGENGLDNHLKTDHDTERLYGCDLCDYVAANEPGILQHLSDKHKLKNQSNKCELCPFETANNAVFEAHVAAHTLTGSTSTIQIGNNSTGKIVGVAAVPAVSQNVELPNACVSIGTKEGVKPNPAVIKPVWIKCSECGFTAQDSEVIKKHMLDHLNMQDEEEEASVKIQHIFNPRKSESVTKQIPPSGIASDSSTSPVTPSAGVKGSGPILIPVSSVEKLLPQNGGKLDMQCPILVPVTNPEIVKNLQSLQTSSKGSARIVRIDNAMKFPSMTSQHFPASSGQQSSMSVPSVNSTILTTTATSINRAPIMHQNQLSVASHGQNIQPPAASAAITHTAGPVADETNRPQVIPLQREQMEALLKNPNFKMVPVDLTAPSSVSGTSDIQKGTSLQNQNPPQPSSSIITPQNRVGYNTSHVIASPVPYNAVKSSAPLTVTQIPVPRMVNTNIPPKLPAEIVQLSPAPIIEEEVVTTSSETEMAEQFEELTEEERLTSIKASLANIERLIEQQDKLSRRIISAPATSSSTTLSVAGSGRINQNGKRSNSEQKVVYHLSPVEKQNTAKELGSVGFTHDSFAGRFRCTLCGYKCEYQRTIKAHIWKHSGNKDLDYPMFQNGPLSIYDDGPVPKEEHGNVPGTSENRSDLGSSPLKEWQVGPHPTSEESECAGNQPSGKMPSFIVYEQTKVSRVAPSLAKLIAARSGSVGKPGNNPVDNETEDSGAGEKQKQMLKLNDTVGIMVTAEEMKAIQDTEELKALREKMSEKSETALEKMPEIIKTAYEKKKEILNREPKMFGNVETRMANVLVETVDSAKLTSGFTGLQSQQNSPRVAMAPKSPDSGITELTSSSQNVENQSVRSDPASTGMIPRFEQISENDDEAGGAYRVKRKLESDSSDDKSEYEVAPESPEGISRNKKVKVMQAHEDSAVTLLSLLKKGPNYNPACPPACPPTTSSSSTFQNVTDISAAASPSQDDSNSLGESDVSGMKPKSGISTSLLAVIEQLRERSKPDVDEDKPVTQSQTKRQSKRRSRRSSVEENTSAMGIGNVEEFECDGVVKYRCRLCHYANDSTLLLKQHMRLHKPKQEFECSLCDLITESNEALQDHMIQHCKVRTYQCKICSSIFNYKSQLRAHMRMHNDLDILICDFCDFETRSAYALKVHTKSHLTKPPYKCQYCKEEFITSFNLRLHIREGCLTSVDKDGTFKCDECGFTCYTRREIKIHTQMHIASYSGTLGKITVMKRCPYCDHSVPTVELLQQHISEVHGESEPLKCDMCGFVAVSVRSLKSHMKRHVNDQRFVAQPLEQYKCNLCGYVCHHLPSLKSHMWRHAADEHYSYEFTNDVINAAIDFDCHSDAYDTTEDHVEHFKNLIFEKMKAKGLENTRATQIESAMACCWVTFRCCQCGFETINKAELNMHMTSHSDVIKRTLGVPEEDNTDGKQTKQAAQIIHG